MAELFDSDRPLQAFDVRIELAPDGALLVRGMEAFELDEVGAAIWLHCDGETSIREISEEVCKNYDVDLQTALRDVSQLLEELRSAGLLE